MRLRLLFLFLLASIIANSQYINRDGYTIWTGRMWVGSGTSVTAPPSNVWLQLGDSATTKALWLPRVQNLTDIPTPKQGMIVYNISDSTVYYRRLFSWTAIGSGGGGSGITQLGTSPFGLIRLNDSTYLVDSMKLITKYQSEKSRDSLGALIATKQATLVSGTNIKTINGNSLLGSGDLVISGGSDSSTLIVDTTYERLAAVISVDTLKLKSIRMQLNGSTITPTVTDSTASWNVQALVAADTASLSNRINQKLNISDTTSKTWDWGDITGKPTTLSGYGITDAIDSLRRVGGSTNVEARKNGVWITQFTDSVGSGGGGSPAGNYGNVQLNRNGSFATPANDSLDFDAGLAIKGTLSATALPTGGVAADSVVVVSSAGALKKRNSSAFVTTNGSTATGQFALFNGSGTVYSSSKFVYADATYPYVGIIGSDPIIYFGAVSNNNPIVGSGSGLSLYGGDTYESINFQTKITGGQQMARFYSSATNIFWHTFNGNIIASTTYSPSLEQGAYTVQRTVPYTTNVNTHGFTDETNFNSQSAAFNSFGSFVKFGNNRNTQDHYASFQSVWRKDSVNQVNKVYDFIAGTSTVTGGTIDSLFRMRIFPVNNTGGTINVEYGIYMPAGSATTKYGAYIEDNVGIGTATPSEKLHVNGAIKTATSGSGSGAWKLGVAVSSSGLTLVTDQYVEISIGGTVYKLALVNAP